MNPYENTGALKDFVRENNLSDKNSNIDFRALVTITTTQNKLVNIPSRIMIRFDGYDSYGKLTILRSDIEIDTNLYPTDFEAKWQQFEYINSEYLFITGTHSKNQIIGQYEVKIIPLGITKD